MGSLQPYETAFASVGWFIPPYAQMGFLSDMAKRISDSSGAYSQASLEADLARLHDPYSMAAMVLHRYPRTPGISDYKKIIAEAVEAHFAGLDKVAVSGLLPVVEGAGKKLAGINSISIVKTGSVSEILKNLAENFKRETRSKSIGDVDEIESMMDSFISFIRDHLFINSNLYTLDDKTNRHGILHGSYSDNDFGMPRNFYKVISAIDFLAFIGSIHANVSWLAPAPTPDSMRLGCV